MWQFSAHCNLKLKWNTYFLWKKPPELKSKYVQFLQKLKQDSLAGKNTMASVGMFNKDYGNTGCEVFTVGIQKRFLNVSHLWTMLFFCCDSLSLKKVIHILYICEQKHMLLSVKSGSGYLGSMPRRACGPDMLQYIMCGITSGW